MCFRKVNYFNDREESIGKMGQFDTKVTLRPHTSHKKKKWGMLESKRLSPQREHKNCRKALVKIK